MFPPYRGQEGIVGELLDAGHSIAGLVRSTGEDASRTAVGGTPLVRSLGDFDVLRRAVGDADGVAHKASGLYFFRTVDMAAEERQAVETFVEVFAGSDRPLVMTGGFGLLRSGQTFTAADRPPTIAGFPRASEQTAFVLVRARWSVGRPRTRHGSSGAWSSAFETRVCAAAARAGVGAGATVLSNPAHRPRPPPALPVPAPRPRGGRTFAPLPTLLMSTRQYQLAVFGCMLSWFLLGLHAPVLHQFTHHGRTPSAPMVIVLLILAAGACTGLVVLLRAPRRDTIA